MAEAPSFTEQRIKAYFHYILNNETFWRSVLIGAGALFLFLTFPFYHEVIAVVLAVVIAYIGSKKPSLAVLLGILIVFPAVAYQSAIFAWLFLLVIAVTLFQMFKNWHIIAILEILILAPFAPYPFSLLGGFVFLIMILSALYVCLLYTSPSPRDLSTSRMPSSA